LPTSFSEGVDDILIFASVGPIDGPKNILAFAGPCGIRGASGTTNRQTFVGVMKFDSDDVDSLIVQGNLTDVIQHEMLHVVGIGTLWSTYGLLAGAGTSSPQFTGTLGIGACIQIGAASVCPGGVPVENSGGAGTRDSHWRESVFASELMTGFVTKPIPGFTGVLNPFSLVSIQSLADLGYQVNASAADSYSVPGTSALRSIFSSSETQAPEWERAVTPAFATDRQGRLILLKKQ
jgi:hypothetical protein